VEDRGVGIPEDKREQIFDRFYRGPSPAGIKVPGVGLGLYISRQLAEHHGGSLVVESSTPNVELCSRSPCRSQVLPNPG